MNQIFVFFVKPFYIGTDLRTHLQLILLVLLFSGCNTKKKALSNYSVIDGKNIPPKAIFEEFDFSSEDYTLYASFWDLNGVRHEKANSLGMFYINDPKVLSKLKAKWIVSSGNTYDCGYDYTLYLTKEDSVVKRMDLSIRCSSLITNKGAYIFPEKYMDQIKGRKQELKPYYNLFSNRQNALSRLTELRSNDKYFIPNDRPRHWEHFPGFFSINFISPYPGEKEATNQYVHEKLREAFDPETYGIEIYGYGSNGSFDYRIYCEKSFMNSFDQFTITKEYEKVRKYPVMAFEKM